jgi:hypothetical protein
MIAPLHMERFIPWRDVRQMVWRHLTFVDRELVRCSQNTKRKARLGDDFMRKCAQAGNFLLAAWARQHFRLLRTTTHVWEGCACVGAIMEGDLFALQLFCAYGCPYDHAECVCVARSCGRADILDWLMGPPIDSSEN